MEIELDSSLPVPGKDFVVSPDTRKQAMAAVNTLNLLEQAGAAIPDPTPQDRDAARTMFKGVVNPGLPAPPAPTPGAIVHLRAIMSEYDHVVAEDAAVIRTYVVNRLLEETLSADARIRLRALELLGKTADVNLFTEPSVGRVVEAGTMSTDELDRRIKEKINKLTQVSDVKYKDIDPMKDIEF